MSNTEHSVEPKKQPRRQFVAAGIAQRRSWTTEQKARIVAESYANNASVTVVAHRHGLTPQLLYRWRRRDRHQVDGARGKDVTFAPVLLEPAREEPLRRDARSPTIEVEIGAMTVRVSAGCDPTTLQMVLHLVLAAS
jgi:transposase